MDTDVTFFSAIALLDGYKRRTLSPVEVLRAVIERLNAENPRLNAFCLVDEEVGLRMARASEARWQKGEPIGLLDGVPIAVKDTNLTKGWPTLSGSRTVDANQDWREDHPAVARLREHGAVFFGKTTSPEFGWKGVTDSPRTGITRNPWHPERTPGGSSGGSAAAVAVGIGPLATGGDGGGSIRIPCSFTGVYGIKPTFGLVPNLPNSLGTMGVPGPLGRTVSDCALMLRVIAEPDGRDPFALPYRKVEYEDDVAAGVKGLHIGFSRDLGFAHVDPEVASAFSSGLTAFEQLGATVEEVQLDLSGARDVLDVIWRAGFAEIVLRLPSGQLQLVEPKLLELAVSAAEISGVTLQHAIQERNRISQQMQDFHREFDLLVTPTVPIPPFGAGLLTPDEQKFPQWYDWTPFTWPFNLTRQPAASCPCGMTGDGLPIGLQIVGPLYREDLVLRASRAFEEARPFRRYEPRRSTEPFRIAK